MKTNKIAGALWLSSVISIFIAIVIVMSKDIGLLDSNIEITLAKIAYNSS